MPRKPIEIPVQNESEPTEAEIVASMEDPAPPEVAKNEDEDDAVPSDGEVIPVVAAPESVPISPTNPEDRIEIDGKTFTREELKQIIKKQSRDNKLVLPKHEAMPGHMLVADCTVKLDKIGSTVHKQNITPAEAMLLTAEHHRAAGGHVVYDIAVKGQVKRTPAFEAKRLRNTYGEAKVKALFPGAIPQLPTTYAEGVVTGVETEIPTQSLTEHKFFV